MMLEEMFTMVTGLCSHAFEWRGGESPYFFSVSMMADKEVAKKPTLSNLR